MTEELQETTMAALQGSRVEDNHEDIASPCAVYCVLAFYRFFPSPLSLTEDGQRRRPDEEALVTLKKELEPLLRQQSARGNVLLAQEGINGTVCYPVKASVLNVTGTSRTIEEGEEDVVHPFLKRTFPGIRTRISWSKESVFYRLKVRIKEEIVTFRQPASDGLSCSSSSCGQYVPPSEWNELLTDKDCLVIDTRNDYEVRIGTFRHSVNPRTRSFPEFASWLDDVLRLSVDNSDRLKQKKIAMFCTGGIRCEKATRYCLDRLHSLPLLEKVPVYHLEGGILAYLASVPESESLFEGECFVFDRRTAVTHGLLPSTQYQACHGCRAPLSDQDRRHPAYQVGVCCPYCIKKEDSSEEAQHSGRAERHQERHKQMLLAQKRGVLHLHDAKEEKMATSSLA